MKYVLELEAKEADAVFRGLGELPAKESMNLIGNLAQQIRKQEAAAKSTAVDSAPVQREDKTP
jgi:hypothetical protein